MHALTVPYRWSTPQEIAAMNDTEDVARVCDELLNRLHKDVEGQQTPPDRGWSLPVFRLNPLQETGQPG